MEKEKKKKKDGLHSKLSHKEPITSVVTRDPSSWRLIISTKQDQSRSG